MKAWIVVALLLILLCAVASPLPAQIQRVGPSVVGKLSSDEHSVDTSLYSRQLFVYGESAQLTLKHSTILVFGGGALTNEIVKNIALTGVGKMVFVNPTPRSQTTRQRHPSLLGDNNSAAQYAAELNRNVMVVEVEFASGNEGWTQLLREHNITAVVASSTNLAALNELDLSCQKAGVQLVACDVHGVCGYVFNNFQHKFQVIDTDGEERKEVVLSNTAEIVQSDPQLLRIASIEEERLNVGIGEKVEILSRKGDVEGGPFEVLKVVDTNRIEVRVPSMFEVQRLQTRIREEGGLLRKVKSTRVLNHQSLLLQLLRPSFCPGNACLPPKRDRAVNLALLACFKVRDALQQTHQLSSIAESHRKWEHVRALAVAELTSMGVVDPELGLKLKGEVGAETIDRVAKGFFSDLLRENFGPKEAFPSSSHAPVVCPATSAVVGAIAAQEVVKAVTHMYSPVSQFLMVEGLDALPEVSVKKERPDNGGIPVSIKKKEKEKVKKVKAVPARRRLFRSRLVKKTKTAEGVPPNKDPTVPTSFLMNSPLAVLYGEEVVRELRSMRVFVVGAGAIGSEVLKNLALLGVGSGAKDEEEKKNNKESKSGDGARRESLWAKEGLQGGGVIVTDMDQIERSNLNRQLLFREKHIGACKSQVAAQQVGQLNPALRNKVRGLTLKVGPETESVFDAAFWRDTDVVVTALDNVAAREYVDSMCVKHCRWMLDSGTLGTKGNTQVVIPHLTESYSSSADPEEEALPLCTLKSFPYQPEHCVAWAKSRFETYFSSEVQLVAKLLGLLNPYPPSTTSSASTVAAGDATSAQPEPARLEQVRAWLETLSEDQVQGVLGVLEDRPWTAQGAQKWAERTFRALYFDEAAALLQEHPAGSADEEGLPFWGGSRRLPTPIEFNPSDPLHSAFVTQVTTLLQRVYRDNAPLSTADSLDALSSPNSAATESSAGEKIVWLLENDPALLSSVNFHMEEFEKDDVSLGHVSVIAALSNLRSRLYGIKELGDLRVQKVAGNIIPALATTTSLVSGLVTLELIKIASERVRFRQERRQAEVDSLEEDTSGPKTMKAGSCMSLSCARSWLRRTAGLASSSSTASAGRGVPAPLTAPRDGCRDISKDYLLRHRSRLLSRFRNAFVNLARPMLAFAQPVEAENTPYSAAGDKRSESFTLWDTIEAPGDVHTLTVESLSEHLLAHYGVALQSVSWGDSLLYADFLPHSARLQQKSLRSVILSAMQSAESDQDDSNSDTKREGAVASAKKNAIAKLKKLMKHEEFVLLDVAVTKVTTGDADDDNSVEESEVTIPKVKVYLHGSTSEKKYS